MSQRYSALSTSYLAKLTADFRAIGEDATVKLIGDSRVLSGHVESIAYGIEDQNRSTSTELLASVNPTFSWVRLAQRIPVRIKLDNVPPNLLLVAGRTATVSIGKIRWW